METLNQLYVIFVIRNEQLVILKLIQYLCIYPQIYE